jgi:N-acetylmuramic acid 6-phosphate etherase
MISTATMVKLGKVYENLMVDVSISNRKLKERAIEIIRTVTGVSRERAEESLEQARHEVKTAIVMIKAETTYERAVRLLERANGNVRQALSLAR